MYKKNKPIYKKILFFGNLFKTSLKHQGTQFFENSTLHGVRYIAESGRPLLEKLLWFCCVSAGAIATVIIILDLWDKFQTNPTITGLDTDFHSWNVPFPALTLCDIEDTSNDSYIDDFIASTWPEEGETESKKLFLSSLKKLNYQTMKDFKQYTTFTNPQINNLALELKSFIFKLVKHCEDLLIDCKWKGEDYDCCSGFFPIFTENGFCYTFNSREFEKKWPWQEKSLPEFKEKIIEETDVKWSFEFSSTSQKLLVFIHNAHEVPSIDTNPQHVWDQKVNKLSFSVKQTYTTDDARQLSIKQRHCIFEDEVKLKIDTVMYTFTACSRQCRMETSKNLCGCVPFFYPLIEGFKYCTLQELSCIIDNLEEIKSVEKCNCELGCSNTIYEVEKLNERSDDDNTNLESEFVSWPMVRYKREVLFGWVDLLVSFGGIAGLFLGFSLLSGVEIIYYFTIRACCMIYTDRFELQNISDKKGNNNKINSGYLPNHRRSALIKYPNVIPVYPKRWDVLKAKNAIVPPFGIEFLN